MLEQTCYSTRNNLNQNDLKEKLTPDESKQLDEAVQKALAWLEEHGPTAEVDAIEAEQKALEAVVHPIMTRLYAENPEAEAEQQPEEPDKE
eukprot:SAG22_NODE_3758_length_1542_cov_1.155925_2_plen_91_part_00